MHAELVTEWSITTPCPISDADQERHELFSTHTRKLAAREMPWLFPLLEASGAKILIGTGMFCFSLPGQPGVWFDVPEMMQRLHLLPWVAEDETKQ